MRWHRRIDAEFRISAEIVIDAPSGNTSPSGFPLCVSRTTRTALSLEPQEKTVAWLGLDAGEYKHRKRSRLVELSASELAERLDWA